MKMIVNIVMAMTMIVTKAMVLIMTTVMGYMLMTMGNSTFVEIPILIGVIMGPLPFPKQQYTPEQGASQAIVNSQK
jgi:hypothetical protein